MNTKLNALSTQSNFQAAQELVHNGAAILRSMAPTTFCYDTIIKHFMNLINSPVDIRKQWEINVEGLTDPDDGLIERSGGEHDHKFFFHFKSMERIMKHMKQQQCYRATRNWLQWENFLGNLERLHRVLSREMNDLILALHDLHPELQLLDRMQLQPEDRRGVLRLLYYKPGNKVAAQPHYDQSLLTACVRNSHPGLYIGDDETNIYHERADGLLVFPGLKAEIATDSSCRKFGPQISLLPHWKSDGIMKAQKHGAIANEESVNTGRWSIVFFYHCKIGLTPMQISELAKQKVQCT